MTKFKKYVVYSKREGKGWEEENTYTTKARAIEFARDDVFKWYDGKAKICVVKVTGEIGNWESREEVYSKEAR